MDTVFIADLVVETVIGVYAWERQVRQRLIVDLEMAWDNRIPGDSDEVEDALDYKAVTDRVLAHFHAHHYRLLEAAAETLARDLQSHFGIPWLKLRLSKPGAVPQARTVGVAIERGTRG